MYGWAVTLISMLVICSGPDTLHAAQKATEMVAGFRAKYDPEGFSYEILHHPQMSDVLNRIAAPSFFATKRMIRADGLLDASKIADIRALAKRLLHDGGQTVVLTLEQDVIAKKIIDEFSKECVVQYNYPLVHGQSFSVWCIKRAATLGVDQRIAQRISTYADDDMWLAEQELQKASANPNIFLGEKNKNVSVYDRAELLLRSQSGWNDPHNALDEEMLSICISQARSAIRVRDASTEGLHPFVVKKLSSLRQTNSPKILLGVLRMHAVIRSGLADISESESLLHN